MGKICCNKKCCSCVMISIGTVLTVSLAVCVIIGVFGNMIREKIDKSVELKKGSETYKNWKSPSSAVYMQYFMFNVTNPSAVQNGSKPHVKQLGPYSYREIRHNVLVDFDNSGNTIAYLSQKAYVFDTASSCAGCDPLTDKVFTINIPLLQMSQLIVKEIERLAAAHSSVRLFESLLFDLVNVGLSQIESVIEDKSVDDLLWGYNDTLLADAHYWETKINNILKSLRIPDKFDLPDVNPLIQLQNNNSNVSAEIYTGVGNIDHLGEYVSWNNSRNLTWWGDKWANMINGTDGSMFHPAVSKDEKLFCFVSDVCRSLYLNYDSTITIRGIKLYRYITPPDLFKYTPVVKAGFCVANNHTCPPNGLLDIRDCQKMDVPIVVSLPHFLFADQSVINDVDGMHPNREDHATFISVEPTTGITMKTNKRIQINVAVDKVEKIKLLSKLRKLYFPVMFVNESACIDEDSANKFKHSVYLPIKIVNIGKYVLIGFGCLLLIIGLLLLHFSKKKTKDVSNDVSSVQVNAAEPDERTPLTI